MTGLDRTGIQNFLFHITEYEGYAQIHATELSRVDTLTLIFIIRVYFGERIQNSFSSNSKCVNIGCERNHKQSTNGQVDVGP